METLNFAVGLAFGVVIYEPVLTLPLGICSFTASEMVESRNLRLFSFGMLSAGLSISLMQEFTRQKVQKCRIENSPATEQAAPAPQEEEVIELKEVNGVYAPNL